MVFLLEMAVTVRPLQGERPKKTTTISVDPLDWEKYQHITGEVMVPRISASSDLGAYIRGVIAKYEGGDAEATAANDQFQLEIRHTALFKKKKMLEETIGGNEETKKRLDKLLEQYGFKEKTPDAEKGLRRMIVDQAAGSGPVQEYLDGEGTQTELHLFWRWIRVKKEIVAAESALFELLKKNTDITPEEIKAAKEAQATSQTQTLLETPEEDSEEKPEEEGEWPDEENEED
jgi:hypothetical protein